LIINVICRKRVISILNKKYNLHYKLINWNNSLCFCLRYHKNIYRKIDVLSFRNRNLLFINYRWIMIKDNKKVYTINKNDNPLFYIYDILYIILLSYIFILIILNDLYMLIILLFLKLINLVIRLLLK